MLLERMCIFVICGNDETGNNFDEFS